MEPALNTPTEPTLKSTYPNDYRELSGRHRFFASGKLFLLPLFALPLLYFRTPVWVIVMLALDGLLLVLSDRYVKSFRCPRCNNTFFGNGKVTNDSLPNGKCISCELPLTPKHIGSPSEADPV